MGQVERAGASERMACGGCRTCMQCSARLVDGHDTRRRLALRALVLLQPAGTECVRSSVSMAPAG
jgi:hypothetical protein